MNSEEKKPQIYVVNYPLQYFTERIGSELVDVNFPAPDDVDPAFWVPTREVITEYQNADLIFINGADYAKWLGVVSLPQSKIVNTSENFRDKYIKIIDRTTHSHGPAGEHSHRGYAFTTWLDPILAIEQAEAINKSLQKMLPGKKDILQTNFENLKSDLLDIDKQLSTVFSKEPNKPILGSHPVYQYLKARFSLNLTSLHLEPDEYPDKNQFLEIENLLKTAPYQLMLWESSPMNETVAALVEMGVKSIVFDPSGNRPETGDYLSVMQLNIENVKDAYN